jgi:predicted nucleotidyltransferase
MINSTTDQIENLRVRFAHFCDKYSIRRLEVFGSVARGESRLDSDLDLLACFDPNEIPSTGELLEMAGEAEEIAGRPVDFLLRKNLDASTNPHCRQSILKHAVCIYGN